MKSKDKSRKWVWWFLGAVVASRFYFVQELIAAFALFAIGFAAMAFLILSLYLLQKGWEMAVARIVESEHLAEQGFETRESARGTS